MSGLIINPYAFATGGGGGGNGFVDVATANATTLTMPEHATDDILIGVAYQWGSNTDITVPAGWTSIANVDGSFHNFRVAYKVAASASETSGTWTGANELLIASYRGFNTADPIGGVVTAIASGTGASSIAFPVLSSAAMDASGTSWILGAYGHEEAGNDFSATTATLTAHRAEQRATDLVGLKDSDGAATDLDPTETVSGTVAGTSGRCVFELKVA
jgi:hypothetical protein